MYNDSTDAFFEQLEENAGTSERAFFETFAEDVEQVFEDVAEEGVERVLLEIAADDDCLTFRLEDDSDMAEYDLFSIHTNGTVEADFSITTSDFHSEAFRYEHLEENPINWFQNQFQQSKGLSQSSLESAYDDFLDELNGWMAEFFADVANATGVEDEMDRPEEGFTSGHPLNE